MPPLLPATRNLLIVGAVTFVLYTVLAGGLQLPLDSFLGISSLPSLGWSWQWATHWLLGRDGAGEAFRKLVELFFIYLMGAQYEALAGPKHTYAIAVAGILGAALGTMATGWITPGPPWGDLALTSALMTGLAVRMEGRPLRLPIATALTPWVFVIVFGVVAALDAVWWHFAPIFGSYAGAVAMAYAYERVISRRPTRKVEPSREGVRRKGSPFHVIEGGGQNSGDEERPKYLN